MSKKHRLIILCYEYPVNNKVDLQGECSPYLNDRNQKMPIRIIRINSRLKPLTKFEVLLHEFFHASADEVFGYQGDEDFVTPICKEVAEKYKTYLLNNKHRKMNKLSIKNAKFNNKKEAK